MLKLISADHEVKNRLQELDLTNQQLSEIAKRAIAEKFNAVENHPVSAPGTFAYHAGVKAMRDILVDGSKWKKLVEKNIEYVENLDKKIKMIYQNVDYACGSNDPQPIARRRGIAKQNSISSNQMPLFELELQLPKCNVFVLCVSENNGIVNAELSLPTEISPKGKFLNFVERIFILKDFDIENADTSGTDSNRNEYDDDIQISMKS